ncbi:transposase, partial [Streptomyces azureus]
EARHDRAAEPHHRRRARQARLGPVPRRHSGAGREPALRPVPPGRDLQRRDARLHGQPRRHHAAALRLPRLGGRVRPDLRPDPGGRSDVLGGSVPQPPRRDQPQRRRPRRVLRRPRRSPTGDHHAAVRQRRL